MSNAPSNETGKPLPPGFRTPTDHVFHKDPRCGCATSANEKTVACPCGATYRYAEVVFFRRWRCYDCGAELDTEDV